MSRGAQQLASDLNPSPAGPQLSHWAALPPGGVCTLCGSPDGSRGRKAVLCPLLDSGFGMSCLMAFAFTPSYEGTGRSLSLKLIQQLRQQSAQSQISTTAENKATATARLASGTPGRACPRQVPQILLQGPLLIPAWAVPDCAAIRHRGWVPRRWSCFPQGTASP